MWRVKLSAVRSRAPAAHATGRCGLRSYTMGRPMVLSGNGVVRRLWPWPIGIGRHFSLGAARSSPQTQDDQLEILPLSALNQRGIRSARGGKWHVSSAAKSPVLATRLCARPFSFRRTVLRGSCLGLIRLLRLIPIVWITRVYRRGCTGRRSVGLETPPVLGVTPPVLGVVWACATVVRKTSETAAKQRFIGRLRCKATLSSSMRS
jgi:hypothetical protein